MKITIERRGTIVRANVQVRTGWAGYYTFYFDWDTGNGAYAGLLAETMDEQLYAHIEAIRKDAYNQGWEDKMKRRKKRTFFGWSFNKVEMPR